jgi:epoxyqueuosine reductase
MQWLERRVDERLDPRLVLEGARSVLCVALQYHPLDGEESPEGDLWPRVARYARGEDYHLVMERRLRRLGERVEAAFPGCRTRTYVDTGPLLERELAARAGLGAIGKNTNLLNPTKGSWLLLGELLLTLELQPDAPYADLCGTCTACLDACPTGALPEPYRLDSRRCISYWTIEHRGPMPEGLDAASADWVFGCDLCQEVCPVNESPLVGGEEAFRLPGARRAIGLLDLLGLRREEYVERFRRSPMKRAKLAGLRRNAAATAGRLARPGSVEALIGALEDTDSGVRVHAGRALSQIGGEKARQALQQAIGRETETSARSALERAFSAGFRAPAP